MFGQKTATEASTARYEYLAEDFVGNGAFNKGVNSLAAQGWEVINASFNGMAHHVYLRRERSPQP